MNFENSFRLLKSENNVCGRFSVEKYIRLKKSNDDEKSVKKKKNSLFVNFFYVAKSMPLIISRNIRRNENWKKSVSQNNWSVWMNDWKKSLDENSLLKSVVIGIRQRDESNK